MTRQSLVGKEFESQSDFSESIKARWSLSALESFCTPARKDNKEEFTQPLLIFAASNWRDNLVLGKGEHEYRVSWDAIVINGRIEAYRVFVHRGEDSWQLETHYNPKLPTSDPGKIRRLIEQK